MVTYSSLGYSHRHIALTCENIFDLSHSNSVLGGGPKSDIMDVAHMAIPVRSGVVEVKIANNGTREETLEICTEGVP